MPADSSSRLLIYNFGTIPFAIASSSSAECDSGFLLWRWVHLEMRLERIGNLYSAGSSISLLNLYLYTQSRFLSLQVFVCAEQAFGGRTDKLFDSQLFCESLVLGLLVYFLWILVLWRTFDLLNPNSHPK